MARTVQEITIAEYHTNWYGKSQTVQAHTAWYDSNQSIETCEKINGKKYRIRLSNGEYKIVESHCIIYLETY